MRLVNIKMADMRATNMSVGLKDNGYRDNLFEGSRDALLPVSSKFKSNTKNAKIKLQIVIWKLVTKS